jgi:hypothetical protein
MRIYRPLSPNQQAHLDRLYEREERAFEALMDHHQGGLCTWSGGGTHQEECPAWKDLLDAMEAAEQRTLIFKVTVGIAPESDLAAP